MAFNIAKGLMGSPFGATSPLGGAYKIPSIGTATRAVGEANKTSPLGQKIGSGVNKAVSFVKGLFTPRK
jgi:hypothetical protein